MTVSPARASDSDGGSPRLRCTSNVHPSTGSRAVVYTGVTGVDAPLLADAAPPGASQLPAGVVNINRQNYLLVTTDEGARSGSAPGW